MRISALKNGDKKVDISGYITELTDEREVQSRYNDETFRLRNALLCETKKPDETNSITLTLWNEDIDKVRLGDKVIISNGYITSYQGKIQLNVGKFGKLVVA